MTMPPVRRPHSKRGSREEWQAFLDRMIELRETLVDNEDKVEAERLIAMAESVLEARAPH